MFWLLIQIPIIAVFSLHLLGELRIAFLEVVADAEGLDVVLVQELPDHGLVYVGKIGIAVFDAMLADVLRELALAPQLLRVSEFRGLVAGDVLDVRFVVVGDRGDLPAARKVVQGGQGAYGHAFVDKLRYRDRAEPDLFSNVLVRCAVFVHEQSPRTLLMSCGLHPTGRYPLELVAFFIRELKTLRSRSCHFVPPFLWYEIGLSLY